MKAPAQFIPAALAALMSIAAAHAAEPATPPTGCFISTGDNHWLGESLPIDSKASIEDSFDLLARLGVRCVYWRGLEEATWMETMRLREENCRYASAFRWFHQLYRDVHPDALAVAAAHRHGMEIWGMGTLVDWQSQGDTPNFNDFPNAYESSLRLDHPEWVPIDRSGLLKQGGPIEFAYPEARKALVDLHMQFVRQDGYDGVIFVTYAENYSMRFQDEFGYNDPIVKEFKRRTGADIRTQPFTRAASRFDWYALRGEYLTQYFRELKEELRKDAWHLYQPIPAAFHATVECAGDHAHRRAYPGGSGDLSSRRVDGSAGRLWLLQPADPEPRGGRLPMADPRDGLQGHGADFEPKCGPLEAVPRSRHIDRYDSGR